MGCWGGVLRWVGGWMGGGLSVRRGGGAEDKQRGKGHVAEMLAKIAGST